MTTKSITSIHSVQISALPLIITANDFKKLTMSIAIKFDGNNTVLNLSEDSAKEIFLHLKENEWIIYDFS